MKRALIVLFAVGLLAVMSCNIQHDGPLETVTPDVEVSLPDSSNWDQRPIIMGRAADPDGIYALAPAMPENDKFAAIRVSATAGSHTPMNIEIGPSSGFRACLPSDAVKAVVHGFRSMRPAFYLMKFGSSKGPGFEYVDSATGRIDIVFEQDGRTRRLLTQRAYNSGRILELLSIVNVERGGNWIAVSTGAFGQGWKVSVFRRGQTTSSSSR